MTRLAPLALVILWSSGFVGATLAARSAPAETTLLWRYVVVVGPLCAWALWTRRRYDAGFLVREGVIGILAHGGYLLAVYRAADLGVLPGTSALVASLQPPLVAALLWIASSGSTDRRQALGLLTGLVGVLLVVGSGLSGAGGSVGLAVVGLGTLSLTAATLVAGRWPQPERHGVLDSLTVQAVVALGFFAALALATGRAAPPPDADFWLAVAWLVVLAFVGGYGTYFYVLRVSGPVVVSAWLYLTPATAAVWAWLMFGEPLTVRSAVGFLVAAAGVAAVVRPQRAVSPDLRVATPARACTSAVE
ncbi:MULTISPECIES: DMT family transporter [Nocardioides]|uniref:DMT family transporter n=1 Tax=Nocardioides vastitatis TaxID=2568655 RepID=A0ABW0ZAK0_9ACTN|nr:DMT family transporter [Nocardioides sp.]